MKSPMIDETILEEASDILDESGWCRGQLTNWKGGHCVVGAIQMARGGRHDDLHYPSYHKSEWDATTLKVMAAELGVLDPDVPQKTFNELFNVNDAANADRRKVQRLLRRVARKVRKARLAS